MLVGQGQEGDYNGDNAVLYESKVILEWNCVIDMSLMRKIYLYKEDGYEKFIRWCM